MKPNRKVWIGANPGGKENFGMAVLADGNELGIPPKAWHLWTAEDNALLGKLTDEEVARKLNRSVKRVRERRYSLGLPNPNPNPKCRHWTKEEIALLGTRPDREVGKLVNRTRKHVVLKRLALGIPYRNRHYDTWKPDEVALLGKLPDEEVARRTGHSLTSVRRARGKRHIKMAAKPPTYDFIITSPCSYS